MKQKLIYAGAGAALLFIYLYWKDQRAWNNLVGDSGCGCNNPENK